ncbi:MAG: oligosaccharide flippase family protein [Bacteroidales bacterium]|nr:oligosaccharide flippase family protein [Bacteroidales bacterium]
MSNNSNNRIAKNTIALYIRMAITMFISFFTTRITLEVLGVEDYGLNNLVSSVVALFSFLNGSMGTAVQRFYSVEIGRGEENKLGRVFGSGLALHIIVALVTAMLMEIFAIFFLHKLNIPQERMYAAQIVFQISILSLILNIISVPYTALLRAREEFSKIAVADVLQSVGRLVVVYLLLQIDYDHLITLGALNFIITILYFVFMVCVARGYKECKHRMCWDKEIVKEIAKFVSMLLVTVLASLFRDKGIIILVNLFFGLAVNAAYAVAMQVMHIVSTFVMNFKQSVVPQIMMSYGKKDLTRMNELVNTGTKITFLLMLLITLPIIFEGEYILKLWLKEPPQYAYELVCLVLININVSSFTYFMYQGVHATGNITKQQIVMSTLYVLNIVGIYIVFELGYSFYSGILVTIVISFLQCITNLYFAKKTFEYNIQNFLKSILPQSLLTITFCMVIMYLLISNIDSSFLRLVASTITSTTIIGLTGYFIILSKEERMKINNIVNSYFR